MMVVSRAESSGLIFGVLLAVIVFVKIQTNAQGLTASIKGTVSATAVDSSIRPELLPGASLTLVNRDLPAKKLTTVTDEAGNFAFLGLPAGTYTLTSEATGLPRATTPIRPP